MTKLSSKLALNHYTIVQIDESDVKARLYEMGLFPNQSIKLVRKAPFGDPIVIQVDDQLVMLREDEASLITVKEN